MRHIIYVRAFARGFKPDRPLRMDVRRAARAVLTVEKFQEPSLLTVSFIDELGIANLNSRTRGVERVTDVLSFPNLWPDSQPTAAADTIDNETGRLDLGDIVICRPVVTRQAEKLGHSERRELCYLTVHAVLHLLGYDHIDEGPQKARMRAREKAAMALLGPL